MPAGHARPGSYFACGASVAGTRHIRDQIPCEDAWAGVILPGALITRLLTVSHPQNMEEKVPILPYLPVSKMPQMDIRPVSRTLLLLSGQP